MYKFFKKRKIQENEKKILMEEMRREEGKGSLSEVVVVRLVIKSEECSFGFLITKNLKHHHTVFVGGCVCAC